METFQVEGLPDIDQQAIKRGLCALLAHRMIAQTNLRGTNTRMSIDVKRDHLSRMIPLC